MGARSTGMVIYPVGAKFIPRNPEKQVSFKCCENLDIWYFKRSIKVVFLENLKLYWTEVV